MYQINKGIPIPGQITELTVKENSIVDNPANGVKFYIRKGDKMSLTDLEKKELEKAGLTADEILKNEGGILYKLKKFFTGEETKPEVLSLDAIQKMFDKTMDEKLALMQRSDNSDKQQSNDNSLADIEKKNLELEEEIKKIELVKENENDLIKKNQELTKKLEDLKKIRTGGNAISKADNQMPLTPQEIKKVKENELFKGSALE